MNTMNKSINFADVLSDMADDFKDYVANLTMTADEKADRIVKKALDRAMAFRVSAREMRLKMILIKDRDDNDITPLESFEDKDADLVKLGVKLTTKLEGLKEDAVKNADEIRAVEAQLGQISGALKTLRANPAYSTLTESYETAADAYKISLDTANRAETNYKILKDNLPMLVKAFDVYKEANQAREDARAGASEQFDPNTFMAGVAGDVAAAKAELRADEDVDRDLDESKPADPVADMLAAEDAQAADEDIMAEFAKAAKKKSKK